MKYNFREGEIISIDIHKYDVVQAKYYLERLIVNIDNSKIKEMVVIHGYNRGNVLQDLVKYELRRKKIERRFLSLNSGRTSLILKSDLS